MNLDGNGFTFESTGRQLRTYSADNLSIVNDNMLADGYDTYCDLFENGEQVDFELTESEKKEVAEYMIKQWAKFGNITLK